MRQLILTLILPTFVYSAETDKREYYQLNDKRVDKVTALRELLVNKSATIYRCQQVEVSDKATIRNKKKVN